MLAIIFRSRAWLAPTEESFHNEPFGLIPDFPLDRCFTLLNQ